MEYGAFLAYFAARAALTAAPGPIVTLLVARSLGPDARGPTAFAAGLCLGHVLAVCAIAMGVGGWAESKPEWFALAKYAGVAYLLWLSIRMWTESSSSAAAPSRGQGCLASAGAGLALCLGNPSTLLIYMLLLPTVAPGGIHSFQQLVPVVLVTLLAVAVAFFGTILLARQVNRVMASPRSSTLFGRSTAATVAITSVWMLAV